MFVCCLFVYLCVCLFICVSVCFLFVNYLFSAVSLTVQMASVGLVPLCLLCLSNFLIRCLTFVYPFGATLNVQKPSVAVLSSGSVSFPLNRPVCAFYKSV